MEKTYLKELAIEQLIASPLGDKLAKSLNTIEKIITPINNLMMSEDSEEYIKQKIGSVIVLAIVENVKKKKYPGEYTKDDWAAIANEVSRFAASGDDRNYSAFVFQMYAKYINAEADRMTLVASPERIDYIRNLGNELADGTDKMLRGEMSEVDYIETSLLVAFEAMIKILSIKLSQVQTNDLAEFTDALSTCAFEYGRYVLYSREQALLTEYIQGQRELDRRLEEKYEIFLNDLNANAERFNSFIADAFDPNIRDVLRSSADLARAAGVSEDEILLSVDDVDEFFM